MLRRPSSTSAKIRVLVKRILRKYGYPTDKQGKATQTVLEQAEVLWRGVGGGKPVEPVTTRVLRDCETTVLCSL